MAIIKPTLNLVSQPSDYSVTAEQGPLSMSMNLSTTFDLTCVGVESGQYTVNIADGAAGWLFDGSLAEDLDGGVSGADGCFLYLKNLTPTTSANLIMIGVVADATEVNADLSGDEAPARLFTLKPQEWAFFPFDHTMNIVVDSDVDATVLEWTRWDRSVISSIQT